MKFFTKELLVGVSKKRKRGTNHEVVIKKTEDREEAVAPTSLILVALTIASLFRVVEASPEVEVEIGD